MILCISASLSTHGGFLAVRRFGQPCKVRIWPLRSESSDNEPVINLVSSNPCPQIAPAGCAIVHGF